METTSDLRCDRLLEDLYGLVLWVESDLPPGALLLARSVESQVRALVKENERLRRPTTLCSMPAD